MRPIQVTRNGRATAPRAFSTATRWSPHTDWQASIDELQALCPNLERVALVVSWFGNDLRAGDCRIVPGVEVADAATSSRDWRVSGVTRAAAYRVSRHDGGAGLWRHADRRQRGRRRSPTSRRAG